MRKEVRIFANCMEHKLKKNDHKGGWEKTSQERLFQLLRQEVDELEAALKNEPELHAVFEAADVANFAMMIAWNALRLMTEPDEKPIPDKVHFAMNPKCEFPYSPCSCN